MFAGVYEVLLIGDSELSRYFVRTAEVVCV